MGSGTVDRVHAIDVVVTIFIVIMSFNFFYMVSYFSSL